MERRGTASRGVAIAGTWSTCPVRQVLDCESAMFRVPLALALLASSAAAADKDPWIRVSTLHFEVFTDAGERAGRDVARHFEQVHSFFLQRFQTGIDPSRKARVLLFRNEKEYE